MFNVSLSDRSIPRLPNSFVLTLDNSEIFGNCIWLYIFLYAMFGIALQLRSTTEFCANREETTLCHCKMASWLWMPPRKLHFFVLSIFSINLFPSICLSLWTIHIMLKAIITLMDVHFYVLSDSSINFFAYILYEQLKLCGIHDHSNGCTLCRYIMAKYIDTR